MPLYAHTVFIDLVKLRQGGRKRLREELLAQEPLQGELSVYVQRGAQQAVLLPMKPDDVLVLEECRLTQLRGASFVLVGFEVNQGHGSATRCEQAWWCRLTASPVPRPMPNLDDVTPTREERRAARMAR